MIVMVFAAISGRQADGGCNHHAGRRSLSLPCGEGSTIDRPPPSCRRDRTAAASFIAAATGRGPATHVPPRAPERTTVAGRTAGRRARIEIVTLRCHAPSPHPAVGKVRAVPVPFPRPSRRPVRITETHLRRRVRRYHRDASPAGRSALRRPGPEGHAQACDTSRADPAMLLGCATPAIRPYDPRPTELPRRLPRPPLPRAPPGRRRRRRRPARRSSCRAPRRRRLRRRRRHRSCTRSRSRRG